MNTSLSSKIESQQSVVNSDPEINNTEEDEEVLLPRNLETSKQSILGRVRTCSNVTVIEWSFIIVSAIAIGVGVGFSIFRLLTVPGNTDQYIVIILVTVNLMFATFYLFHGIFQEQPFEILMLIFTTILMWILVTMNYASEETESDQIKLVRFLVSTILSLPNVILAGIVGWGFWSSGNLVFKTVGGEIKLQRMCRMLFFGYSLLVFDAQAAISCLILVLEHGLTEISQEEIVVVVSGTVFIGLWLAIGFMSMRTENIRLTWLFAITSVIQPAYVVYLFVKSLEQIKGSYSLRTQSAFLAEGVLVVAHFSLLATLPTISFNYGNGLRGKIYGEFTPEASPVPGSSRRVTMKDEDMEPLIEPTTPRQNYQSTVVAIVTVH